MDGLMWAGEFQAVHPEPSRDGWQAEVNSDS
jgi:hypothetical protein